MAREMVRWLAGGLLAIPACTIAPRPRIDPGALPLAASFDPMPPPPPSGLLRVRTSATEWARGDDVPRWLHEGYDLFDSEGRFVGHVANHASFSDERPTTLRLAPGTYYVAVPDAAAARLWVEVVVAADRLTEPDLSSLKAE